MNRVLEGLKPSRVFYYFEEISKIPRGSRNTAAISEYCKNFAKQLDLECRQDEMGNLIIKKPATAGRENDPGVMLQGHLDMVNEKKPGVQHDFDAEGLTLKVDGDYVYADGTTLGGDDGIGVAYALAILEDKEISHPALEIVFTVDEEIGLLGAAAIDLEGVTSKYLINLDSEEDSVLWAGCAGGMTSVCKIPLGRESFVGMKAVVKVSGLRGGHSGAEIDKGRANANILLGRVLHKLKETCLYSIQDIKGGLKDNAIPREAEATIVFDIADQFFIDTATFGEATQEYIDNKINEIETKAMHMSDVLRQEYEVTDPNISVTIEVQENDYYETYNMLDTDKVVFFLMMVPNGVQNMSRTVENLVETSLNLGILKVENDFLVAKFSVRSSVESRKRSMGYKLKYVTEYLGGDYSSEGNYPGWNYKINSPLRDTMTKIYEKMFGETPQVKAIHAGLECGYLLEKCPWLDIISFGPNILDIHTTEERMSISSVEKVYRYLLEVLKEIK